MTPKDELLYEYFRIVNAALEDIYELASKQRESIDYLEVMYLSQALFRIPYRLAYFLDDQIELTKAALDTLVSKYPKYKYLQEAFISATNKLLSQPQSNHKQNIDCDTDYNLDTADSIGVYCIQHFYNIGDQRIYVKRASGEVDAKRAAIYCQFLCEEWFGSEKLLTNLGVASLLVSFYGFQHYMIAPSITIDLHIDRADFCGYRHHELISDATLKRDGLYEFMRPHVIG